MSGGLSFLAPWLALTLMAAVAACAFAAATARSLVAMCLTLWSAAALAAAALLTMGQSNAALAMALLAACLAPVLVLATLLLSARVVKANKRRTPLVTAASAILVVGAIIWLLPNMPAAPSAGAIDASALFFAGPLLLAAVAAAVGLLGFGERGALEKFAEPADE
jgi:hypothetical protein